MKVSVAVLFAAVLATSYGLEVSYANYFDTVP